MFRKVLLLLVAVGVLAPGVWICIEHFRGRHQLAAVLKEFRDRNEPLDLQLLWPGQVPSASNGLNAELSAVARMTELGQLNVPVMMLGGPGKAVPGTRLDGWAKDKAWHTWDEVGAAIDRHAGDFEALQAALERPYRRLPLDLSSGFSKMRIAHLGPLKSAVMCLGVSAIEAARRGDFENAMTDLQLARVVEKDLESEPLFISQLVRLACNSINLRHAWVVLHTASWTPEQLKRLQNHVASGPAAIAPILRGLQGERAGVLPELQGRGGYEVTEVFGLSGSSPPAGGAAQTLEVPATVDEAVGMAEPVLVRVVNFLLTRIVFPIWYFGWGDQAIVEYLRAMEVLLESGRQAVSSVEMTRRLNNDLLPRIRPGPGYSRLRSLFASSLMAAFEKAVSRGFRAETEQALLTSEIAVRRYLAQRGQLPETLEMLVPEYLEAVPVDRMDGQPIRYRREAVGGFVLWSVGEDGKDDGGHASMPENRWHGRTYSPWLRSSDAVWPQPASDEERAAWVAEEMRLWEKARSSQTNSPARAPAAAH
ncbi:MAG: hypothetical protein IT581_16745 [Verrucomicrobiales bacterium]|nr:hypothetical protein [Verrucomicrobiales bacterium]